MRAAVFLLGMHRSGTSFTAGLMPAVGLQPLRGPVQSGALANEKGNLEIPDLWSLNNRLLGAAGHAWHAIQPPFEPVQPTVLTQSLKQTAAKTFRRLVPEAPWYWKDPRLCFTLPIFREFLEPPERAYAVLTSRHPLEVARSLQKRNGFDIPVGLALWEAYMHAGLRAIDGLPTFFVPFDRSLANPESVLEQVHGQLVADGVLTSQTPDRMGVQQWAEPKLRHHRAEGDHGDASLLSSQQSLWEWLESRPVFDGSFRLDGLESPSEWSVALLDARSQARGSGRSHRSRRFTIRRAVGRARRAVSRPTSD